MAELATTALDAHHFAYVDEGAITVDPTLMPGYNADEPDPGVALLVVDREGWATLHRVEARSDGKIEFGPRQAWPDGGTAARKVHEEAFHG